MKPTDHHPSASSPKQVIPLERLRAASGGRKESLVHVEASRPTVPDLWPALHCLEPGNTRYRDPEDGELIVGLYREYNGSAATVLLWADPKVDLFWDVTLRQHVKAPTWYVRIDCQPPIDPATGYPLIHGAVCPF